MDSTGQHLTDMVSEPSVGHSPSFRRTISRTIGGTMPATVAAAVGDVSVPALSLDAFKGQFNITSLIDNFALPVLDQQRQSKANGFSGGLHRPKDSLQDSLQVTEKLVQQFDRSRSFCTL